ncbi:AI-2E family transporter [Anaerosalibacter bizertensis]|uniref:AI-2E family transporter n=1 Tax=Anaerosalibacter bizertensis TaxID=932217 RepID=UPI001C0F2872|nr:AI-2E family transporter [Anaerosalibacter bizertensis]MBU5292762.1 AI-2E family transporter [Anaerosalibacter bizertensis]
MNFKNISLNLQILIGLFILISIYYIINIGNKYIEENKKIKIDTRRLSKLFIFLLFIFLVYILTKKYKFLSEIINILVLSSILAYLLNPIVDFFKKKNIPDLWSVIFVYIIIFLIIFIFSFVLIPKIIREFRNIGSILPDYLNKIYEYIDRVQNKYYSNFKNLPPQFDGIRDIFEENINNLERIIIKWIKKFVDITTNAFSKIFTLILVPIISFYFLKDKEFFKKKIYLTIPKAHRGEIVKLFKEMDKSISQFIRGRIIVGIFVGITTTIALFILNIDFAFSIGMLAGIADIIPYFGPVIGIIPAVFFALLEGPLKALWVIITFTIIQQIENNIITPKVVGESVGIHPVTVIISLILGGGFFGILGMILAIPVVAVVKILYSYIVEKVN